MRIVYMGTPDFAVLPLQKLIKSKHNVVAVFTQPDKPKGRGYQLQPPPVKVTAQAHNIPVYQPQSIKTPEMLAVLQQLAPDIIVVVAYGQILPKPVLDLPPYGCVNVHASLLPKYRGAAPIQWCIVNGEKETGVTTMYMAQGLDTGDMILKYQTPISPEETAGELSDRLSVMGADCLLETIALIEEGKAPRQAQREEDSCYASMIQKSMAEIDFTKPAQEVHQLVMGFSPAPAAYTFLGKKRLKVYRSRVVKEMQGEAGAVLATDRFIVACKEGAIELLEVQLEGSKRMLAKDFLRGKKLIIHKKLAEN